MKIIRGAEQQEGVALPVVFTSPFNLSQKRLNIQN